jgi:hypothetical protein
MGSGYRSSQNSTSDLFVFFTNSKIGTICFTSVIELATTSTNG